MIPGPTLLVAALASAIAAPMSAQRPEVRFTTDERFDASSVPAYRGDHAAVYAHIDANQPRHLENLRRWLRQPSISAEDVGIGAMAEMLRDDLLALGFAEAELVPTSGHPGVWGYYDAGADHTLAVYMMYDVQPADAADWRSPPFEAEIVDVPEGRAIMARGATNQKGPQRAFLNAVESIIAVHGSLPVNLMIVAEGEEELGSPNYAEVIDRYEDRLRTADGVFFPSNGQNPAGRVSMFMGVKGIVYFEMQAMGGAWGGPTEAEIHSSLKAIVDAPALRLVQAIASLTTRDGNTIAVPGYYDDIRAPSFEEQRLVNGMLADWSEQEAAIRQAMAIDRWLDDVSGRESLLRYLFDTTLNVDGIWGGYAGPGTKTVLPHVATAKLDSRLVPNQTPERAIALIREHLDRNGFADIEIRVLGAYEPAQSSVESPLAQSVIAIYNKHGSPPSVAPRIGGSAPYYIFTERLALPMVAGGMGYGTGAHAPNEYIVVEPGSDSPVAGLAGMEKFYADLLLALAERSPGH
jgi:acetylornithine deacetylase/succinyl-diaminopimelate desuccinylase-like protein